MQRVVCHLVRRDSSAIKFDRVEIAFILALLYWLKPLTDEQLDQGKFVVYLTSQQHASVSQARICSDNFTCCLTEIEVADQTFYLTRSLAQG